MTAASGHISAASGHISAASGHISAVHLWTLSKYKKYLSIQLLLCDRLEQTADTHSDCRHTHTLHTQTVSTHTDCGHPHRMWTLTQTV